MNAQDDKGISIMKIVLIHGQNHQGSTYHAGRLLVDALQGDKEISEFFLPRDLEHFCLGCYRCIEEDTDCPFYEEKHRIMAEVEQADLLIFTTPNYCMNMSAPMKTFIDLTFTYWMSHRPRACMFEKRALVVSTTAGFGAGAAARSVKKALFFWGVPRIYCYGVGVQALNWAGVSEEKKTKIKRDMQRLAKRLSTKAKPRIGLKTRFIFSMMANMQKAGWGASAAEKRYWTEMGWLERERPWRQDGKHKS